MLRASTALLAGLVLALGLAACGGGDSDVSDVIPKTTPDLVAPKDTSLPEVTASTSSTSTNPTTSTPAASSDTSADNTSQPTSTTGGSTGGTGTTPAATTPDQTNTNGSQAGGLSPFCDSNPDAC